MLGPIAKYESEKRSSLLETFRRRSAVFRWLPDLDLNQDKQIQSLLCYRYTIGQSTNKSPFILATVRASDKSSDAQLLGDAHGHQDVEEGKIALDHSRT